MSTGSHEPTQGSPACSVDATGSTSLKPRTTRVQRTLNGVYNKQIMKYPRGAYTQQGSHQSIHGLPACGVHATGSTSVKTRSSRVEPTRYGAHTSQVRSYPRSARYGVHASQSTDYPRGARATESTRVHSLDWTHVSFQFISNLYLSSSQSSTFITFNENLIISI